MTDPTDPTIIPLLMLILLPIAVCLLAMQIAAAARILACPPRELGGCSQNCAQGRRCSCKEKK